MRSIKFHKLQKKLPQILEKIPYGNEIGYGFESRDEFLNSTVGTPFKFYNIKKNELVDTSPYCVPIMVGNEFRALATLDYIHDNLQIVDFGSNSLAKEIQMVCHENKTLNFIGILRIYEIYSDFLVVSKDQKKLFIPLTSAKRYLHTIDVYNNDKLFTESQIINLLKNK